MTSAARVREAERATKAMHLALMKVGAATVEDALDLWQDVNPADMAVTVERWHAEAIQLVLTRRGMSRNLVLAFYRLVRALRTGRTVAAPGEPVRTNVTLAQLRREFALLVRESDALYTGPPSPPEAPEVRADEAPAQEEYDHLDHTEGNGDVIPEEPFEKEAERDFADREQEALDEIEEALEVLGPSNLEKKLAQVDDSQPAREADEQRAEAFDDAGARQAAAASRVAMNGGREAMFTAINHDRRSLGWARISLSGSPCGWCAMLISRGAVYRTKGTATTDYIDGDAYHDNCNCTAIPVFSRTEMDTSPTLALNRELHALWQKEIANAGLTGKQAIAEFRRLMRARARSAAPTTQATQEVAA